MIVDTAARAKENDNAQVRLLAQEVQQGRKLVGLVLNDVEVVAQSLRQLLDLSQLILESI